MHILRKCPCPVWLVKPQASKSHQRILASVDVGDNYPPEELNTRQLLKYEILNFSTSLAISESANLDIVYVWNAAGKSAMRSGVINKPEDEISAYTKEIEQEKIRNTNELMNKVSAKVGQDASTYSKPEIHLLRGNPSKRITEFATEMNADIMVMGTVSRTGILGFFMGNKAQNILNQLNCSVLAIKPPEFVSPVTLNV